MSEPTSAWFEVADDWRRAYPGAAAGWLALGEVGQPDEHPALDARRAELEAELRARFSDRAELRALPVLQAYDAYYRRFRQSYHVQMQLESVALKGRPIPCTTPLVEAMFVAELQDLLLTAGHDLDTVQLPLRLDVAGEDERYLKLNGQEQALTPGDMCMVDREGVTSAVLHGPDQRTRIRPETRRALFAVYAPEGVGAEAVERHLGEIRSLVALFAPQAQVLALQVVSAD